MSSRLGDGKISISTRVSWCSRRLRASHNPQPLCCVVCFTLYRFIFFNDKNRPFKFTSWCLIHSGGGEHGLFASWISSSWLLKGVRLTKRDLFSKTKKKKPQLIKHRLWLGLTKQTGNHLDQQSINEQVWRFKQDGSLWLTPAVFMLWHCITGRCFGANTTHNTGRTV